jgi:Cys-tRNA synthase (O-phospho-L-seryl-tRNA:Cys-tRNA synthase)
MSERPAQYRNGVDRVVDLLKKLAAVLLVSAIGYLGERGTDGGFIKDVWVGLKTASPVTAMVMFLLFMDERRERREAQRQCNERTVDFIGGTHAMSATVATAVATFNSAAALVQNWGRDARRRRRRGRA